MDVAREKLEGLLYGGSSVPRFTQDTPILPDVWIAYGQPAGEPQHLILNPFQDPLGRDSVTAGMLAAVTGLMHNGWILALVGSTESIVAGVTVITSNRIAAWRFRKRLENLL